ncbi:GNAT family N-acetyltransferase [Pseudomonas sp. MH10]|uniref:GNAT family N-acetyltransferase n=1 Tax=Pseudomonas sp. MH10 TaxID=3048627 RepID=UPI002AC978D1|nr:GNAT family N-acetyltransferase [Pseudomonas sp. MH10]MEB0039807.1 GNAT family N-acetyltransferase [Pseudomonas sp. MH10]WPX64548.1 GNAT family N-acetyltransferase [Pseudomonas sp. MH10]
MTELTISKRLIFRRPEISDLKTFFTIFGDPRTQQFNPAGPILDEAAAYQALSKLIGHWDEHGFGQWAILSRDEPDVPLGFGGLTFHPYNETTRLNVGYRLAFEAWGKGFATEIALTALQQAALIHPGEYVFGLVRPSNLASIHVLQKSGMQLYGTLDDVPGKESSLVYRTSGIA